MQAHANDLRSEIASDWATVIDGDHGDPPSGAQLDGFVHQVVNDWRVCPLPGTFGRLVEWAEAITRTPAACDEIDVASLRESGWSDVAIHDAAQVVAYFNYINRIADALGVEPENGLPRWGGAGA